ncbi:beta-N-acetylhexosaminidase [Rugamonas sp. CCM 8940]|uniref:beta-N-acetylhexosaminidase n=1 Tax=Rugamonas sp. CCM 8940 TaxID=2765359 RepID=UPI0018F7663F|nr:beta-N-acetylhexosaminidase [Rugamonas sp. CCM 8940]MBJ7311212.1 beta-N-acetylhexosaminidase [Rugamonas sp. CCM 8940]
MNTADLTLREMVGQMLIVGFDGLEPSDEIASLIREGGIGGVILFRRNVDNPRQVARLTRQLQEINAERSAIPLFIAVDQEGGIAIRIEEGLTPLLSPLAWKQGAGVADCRTLHEYAGNELKTLGVNMNFAPVLDINFVRTNPVIGVRAFGESVLEVSSYGMAALAGWQDAGIAVTAKHFPGHGDTSNDSHTGMPLIGHTPERMRAVELAPFRAAIDQGVDVIMTAHVAFPAFEPDPALPATLSRPVLTGLLREELGFDGLICSDCLEMHAIAHRWGTAEGAVRAVGAGADLALVSHRPEQQRAALAALLAAVEQGVIERAQVEESVDRILHLKQKLTLEDWYELPEDPQPFMQNPVAMALSEQMHRHALRRRGRLAGLRRDRPVKLLTFEIVEHAAVDRMALGKLDTQRSSLASHLRLASHTVDELVVSHQPEASDLDQVLRWAEGASQIVVMSYNAVLSPRQQVIIATLPSAVTRLVAGNLPYDLDLFEQLDGAALCSNRPMALKVLAQALSE